MLARRIITRLRGFAPDVVHFLGDSVLWLLLALPWLRRFPLVVTVHDVVYHPGDVQSRRVPIASVRRFRRAADALIVHGQGLRDALIATGVRPPGGVHVVAHPILDRHARLAGFGPGRAPATSTPSSPAASTNDAQRLLFFGRAMAYKGLAVLVEAAEQLVARHPAVRLVIAGAGPELDRLAPMLERQPWVELHRGYVPDEAVADLFHAADAVILPYEEASQSGVAAMAMAFARPVVASEVGELGELVRETGMGLLVPPGDATALAAAIDRLLETPALRRGLRVAAIAAAAGVMSPGAVAAATLEVYAHAIAGHSQVERRACKCLIDVPGGSAVADGLAQPPDQLACHAEPQQGEAGESEAAGERATAQGGGHVDWRRRRREAGRRSARPRPRRPRDRPPISATSAAEADAERAPPSGER